MLYARKRKGQMVFEFIIAAVLFFAIVFYIISYLSMNVSDFNTDSHVDDMNSKLMKISELMLHTDETRHDAGLRDEWPLITEMRIQEFSNYCTNNYDELLGKLELTKGMLPYNIKIKITDTDDVVKMECPGITPPKSNVASMKRFAINENSDILILNFWLW